MRRRSDRRLAWCPFATDLALATRTAIGLQDEEAVGEGYAVKRKVLVGFWKLLNPLTRRLAGVAPWWVLVETTGRRSGRERRTPLAAGPVDEDGMWLIAVHGRASWVLNLQANAAVRVRHRGRWREGIAEIRPWDPAVTRRFNPYARSGPVLTSIDPVLVHITFAPPGDARLVRP